MESYRNPKALTRLAVILTVGLTLNYIVGVLWTV